MLGVLVAGALLGRVGHEGLIPSGWIEKAVGGNSLRANFFSSFAGAFMYFATLTEVPILQGLIGSGMGMGAFPAFFRIAISFSKRVRCSLGSVSSVKPLASSMPAR